MKSEDTVFSLLSLIQIGIKDPAQLTQTSKAWLLPVRRSVEKWIAESQKGSQEIWHKMLDMDENLFVWRIVVENLDRIDEAMKRIMSP